MTTQLRFGDIQVGDPVPELVKKPTTRELVMWAGGSGDFYEVHYDQEFARQSGLANVIVHGRLKASYLTQMLTDWIGTQGVIRKFSVRYREVDLVAQPITCGGKVTALYERDGQHWVDCEVWTQNAQGKQTTTGNFAFTVPA